MSTNINIRVDVETKKQAEVLFNELGINLSSAINMFLKQSIRENGLPFQAKVNIPNEETLKAIKEVQEMSKNTSLGKSYDSAENMFKELLA